MSYADILISQLRCLSECQMPAMGMGKQRKYKALKQQWGQANFDYADHSAVNFFLSQVICRSHFRRSTERPIPRHRMLDKY